jgi:integrase
MNATILKRELKKNRTSLLLDVTANGTRTQETLKMYLVTKPKTQEEKDQNKEIWNKAELIRVRRLNSLLDNKYDINNTSKSKLLMLDYFNHLVKAYKRSKTAMIWHSAVIILTEYLNGEEKLLKDIKEIDVEKIKSYFLNDYVKKDGSKLSSNSAATYFSKIKAGLNQAYRDKLINYKISDNVKSISKKNSNRKYLTIDELQKLKNTDCANTLLKTAFLFSAITGLRWSDITKLTWGNIKRSSDRGHFISFVQQKTDSEEWLPINEHAIRLIGDREDDNVRIFKGLTYSPHFKTILAKWLKSAEINKVITFHCARHSYATALVTKDVNMSTISKMLGHKDIRTTQIYAKVVDKSKIDAAQHFDIF